VGEVVTVIFASAQGNGSRDVRSTCVSRVKVKMSPTNGLGSNFCAHASSHNGFHRIVVARGKQRQHQAWNVGLQRD
jgi:hypothetical protein